MFGGIARKGDTIVATVIVKTLMLWSKLQMKTILNFLVTSLTINMWMFLGISLNVWSYDY